MIAQCAANFAEYGGIYPTLFLAGLIGGFTHCSGMCGPFVMGQVAARLDNVPANKMSEWQRLKGAALLPYHLGRMTTYTVLGIISATVLYTISASPMFHYLSASMLIIAGLLFFSAVLNKLNIKIMNFTNSPIGGLLFRIPQALFKNPTGWRGYLLGILLGFLPCALVFAALMAAAATGNPITAALAMALFTLGTIPALFMVGLGGNYAFRRFGGKLKHLPTVIMLINGTTLIFMAGEML